MRLYVGVFSFLFILFGVLGRSLGAIMIVKKTSTLFHSQYVIAIERPLNNGQLLKVFLNMRLHYGLILPKTGAQNDISDITP